MRQLLTFLLFGWLFVPASAFQSENAATLSHAPEPDSTMFESLIREDYLEMTLALDFKFLLKNKKGDTYQPAALSFTGKEGQQQLLNIEIKPRGNIRREICQFPPLKLKFSKSDLSDKGFRSFRKIEMVMICKDSRQYEQFLLREYFAYRLYNLLSGVSFRVQLAKVKFMDTGRKDPPIESFAFLIEHDEEMEERTHGKFFSPKAANARLLNNDEFELFSLFQFMIGNTDWYIYNGHNVKVMVFPEPARMVPIPYDFDYAGLVNAPYAVPHEELKLLDVTDRYYQGYCRSEEETMKTIGVFLDKKEEILQLCEQFSHFDEKSRKHVLSYLQDFFGIIEDARKRKVYIFQHCGIWMRL